eukprot:917864-Pleurochrysis_carterae.AAC.1
MSLWHEVAAAYGDDIVASDARNINSGRLLSSNCDVAVYGGTPSNKNYGAWTICPSDLEAGSTTNIFSVGIGGDITFDMSIVRRHRKAHVWCFDPTISKQQFDQLLNKQNASAEERERISFFPFGLGARDDVMPMYKSENPKIGSLSATPGLPGYRPAPYLNAPLLQVHTLAWIATRQPHQVDLLKVDVEGAEFDVFSPQNAAIRRWLYSAQVSQVLIEFHDRFIRRRTRTEVSGRAAVTTVLRNCGFLKRHVSASKEEVLFVRIARPTPQCVND